VVLVARLTNTSQAKAIKAIESIKLWQQKASRMLRVRRHSSVQTAAIMRLEMIEQMSSQFETPGSGALIDGER